MDTQPGETIVGWAAKQLALAQSILDNPGGGLVSATQTIGQVKAALRERDRARWGNLAAVLDQAEDAAVRREFEVSSRLLTEAMGALERTS